MMTTNKNSGFTMIELVIVITLVGVLSIYAESRFSTEPYNERYFADDVVSALRFAQKTALASGCAVRFNIGTSVTSSATPTPAFELLTRTAAECAGGAATFGDTVLRPWQGGDYINQASLPEDITAPAVTIDFFPQGWACSVDGESTTVADIDLNGASANRTISVVCSTGFVYMENV